MPEIDLHARFGTLSDDAWRGLLFRSLSEPEIEGAQFPAFPDPATQMLFNGSPPQQGLAEAFAFFRIVKDACAAHGRPLGPTTRLLDFGVGWARVLRCFMKDVPPDHLFGVDVNPDILAFCRRHVPAATYAACTPGAPLPYADGSFDVIESFSVFSHLSPAAHAHWLTELHRVLRPGGLLALTTLSRRFLDTCEHMATETPPEGLGRDLGQLVRRTWPDWPRVLRRYRRKYFPPRDFFYLPAGGGITNTAPEDYGWAMVTREWAQRHWRGRFDIVIHGDDARVLEQAWFVLRKRPATSRASA